METYLEGVVESEGGPGQKLNYYKAQAVISRTYAMKYWTKHKENGYNLCDRVHCQAYLHHRSATVTIDSVAVHPLELVTVTGYVPGVVTDIDAVVAPVPHK